MQELEARNRTDFQTVARLRRPKSIHDGKSLVSTLVVIGNRIQGSVRIKTVRIPALIRVRH